MNDEQLRRGVARLMVRRHLSDLIRPEIGTEHQIVAMFARCMAAHPDESMDRMVLAFRRTVDGYLAERVTYRTLEGPR